MLAGLAITSGLSKHQDVFNVILNDRVWFIRLPQKRGAIFDLIACIGDLVPQDRGQVIEADSPAAYRNIRVEGHYHMPPTITSPGKTDIPDHTHEATTRNQGSVAMTPNFVEFIHELVIALDRPQLGSMVVVLL